MSKIAGWVKARQVAVLHHPDLGKGATSSVEPYIGRCVHCVGCASIGGDSCHESYRLGRNSSVGIATRYGLNGPGIESRGDEIFRTRPDRPWVPPVLLYNGYRVSFPGVKRPGRGVNHTPPLPPRLSKE